MSLERELKNFEEAEDATIRHEINCPSCEALNTIITAKYDPLNRGQITCKATKCRTVFVYMIMEHYEILTATVNEFNDNQL